jgi:hypothetical protein
MKGRVVKRKRHIDRIAINLNPGSDSDSGRKNSDTDCDNGETASEYNNTTPHEDTGMELA